MGNIFDPTEKRQLYGVIFVHCSMIVAIVDLALFNAIIGAIRNASDMKLVLVTSFCVLLFMVMTSVAITFRSFPVKVFSIQVAITGYFALLATLGIPLVSDHGRYSAMCIGSVVFATVLGIGLDFAWDRVCTPKADGGPSSEIISGDKVVAENAVEASIQEADYILYLFRAKIITQQECETKLNAVRAKVGLPPQQHFSLGGVTQSPIKETA